MASLFKYMFFGAAVLVSVSGAYTGYSNVQQVSRSSGCSEKYARYPTGQCDAYIECVDGVAEEKLCPEGLLFNANLTYNQYPCQYPIDVACQGRTSLQPAQPTEDCPHQFGYFRLGDSKNCGQFRNCVDGRGFDVDCPEGLAFNPKTYRCDWPDEVEECDAEAYLGFRCPEVPVSRELGAPVGYRSYKSPGQDCRKFFICIDGKPRLQNCGEGKAFDELTNACEDLETVESCSIDLRKAAKSATSTKYATYAGVGPNSNFGAASSTGSSNFVSTQNYRTSNFGSPSPNFGSQPNKFGSQSSNIASTTFGSASNSRSSNFGIPAATSNFGSPTFNLGSPTSNFGPSANSGRTSGSGYTSNFGTSASRGSAKFASPSTFGSSSSYGGSF